MSDDGQGPMAMMRWDDRVYGELKVEDPGVQALIDCPTFRRLQGIKQAGPSALAFPFKTVTRFEHSLGVYLLLGKLGADRREQVAGLLHDISHTAFSHAVDFVFDSEHQDHHEGLKPEFLARPDIVAVLAELGYKPEEFFDDAVYPLLEQPLPGLCADRLDYFFRDSLACSVTTPEQSWPRRLWPTCRSSGRRSSSPNAMVARREAAEPVFRHEPGMVGELRPRPTSTTNSPTPSGEAFQFRRSPQGRPPGGRRTRAGQAASGQRGPDRPEAPERRAGSVRRPWGCYAPRVQPKTRWIDPSILDGMNVRRLSDLA